MRTRVFGFAVAVSAVSMTISAEASTIEGHLIGTVTGYETFLSPVQVAAAFPVGTPVSAEFSFNPDGLFQKAAIGSVQIGSIIYNVASVYSDGGGVNVNGQEFIFESLELTGPTVPSGNPNYFSGNVRFEFGLPYPNPIGLTIVSYPFGDIGVTYGEIGGSGANFDQAKVTFTAGDVTAVPEPATWAELSLGFIALGGLIRRPRAPAMV